MRLWGRRLRPHGGEEESDGDGEGSDKEQFHPATISDRFGRWLFTREHLDDWLARVPPSWCPADGTECLIRRIPSRQIPRAISMLHEEPSGEVRPLSHTAAGPDLPIRRQLGVADAHLRERQIDRIQHVPA